MTVAILGAGVAGLSAARQLRHHGIEVKLFEKSRGVGGRMSTRYAGAWEFDHGAQFLTVQDIDFRREIDAAIAAGVVTPWPARAKYLKAGELSTDTGRDRFVGRPRMNSLPKYWARGLDIELGRRVSQIVREAAPSKKWSLKFEDGQKELGFDAIISTLPPAQAKDVLPRNFVKRKEVSQAQMRACFCLMVGLAQPIDPGWDSLRIKSLPIDWMALNHSKPGRSQEVGTLVIHAEAGWSDRYANADRDWVQNILLSSASTLLGLSLNSAPHLSLHRWLYASNKISPNRLYLADDRLVVAGDWCTEGRVQGAWLSGRAAARALMEML